MLRTATTYRGPGSLLSRNVFVSPILPYSRTTLTAATLKPPQLHTKSSGTTAWVHWSRTMATTTTNTPPATGAIAPSKKAPKEKPASKFSSTLLLPKTPFPIRSEGATREAELQSRYTTDLYPWQRVNNPGELFVLHDGPPYANGHLHLGHALNKLIKDFVNRYRVMRGFRVDYRPGWDCHGLPIELKALAELKVKDRSQLSPMDIRTVAQASALSAIEVQKKEFLSYGIMGDFDNGYVTMSKDFETRQLKVFHEMMNKGLIYRANKPVYWSPSSQTALAESELEYKDDHKSRSAWVGFEVEKPSEALYKVLPKSASLKAVIWTTTPWTLPANRCVAVHPKLSYTLFRASNSLDPSAVYLAATDRMGEMKRRFNSSTGGTSGTEVTLDTIGEVLGQDLVGAKYKHPLTTESLPFITADYVTADSGSGLVHTAPGHGMDDYKACLPLGIEAYCPVDNVGKFTAEAGKDLEGLHVQTDGTAKVIDILKEKGSLIQEQAYVHKYPYDWRTKKPVILRATSQWFANVGTIKEDALKAIENVRIVPESARRRLEGFVQSRTEWCISRQRSWGVPIPVLYEVETDEPLLTGASVQHIINMVKEHGTDAWWTMSTEELLAPEYRNNGKEYRRGFDTMDVWFDSGTSWTMIEEKMPRPHLPFVADVYSEGSDQHRGWFQSSLLTSVALTGKAPYGTLITHGFLLDEKGFKQSKSLGNTVDPAVVIFGGKNLQKNPAYGTDVLRLWAASSEYTKDIAIGKTILSQVAESVRKFRITARFLLGNLNGFKENEQVKYEDLSRLDKFMLAEVYQFSKNVTSGYDDLLFNKVFTQLQYFTSTTLSSFYLDIIKDSLYSDAEKSLQRRAIQTVLFHTLNAFTRSIAPLAPHLSEEVYEHYRDCFATPQPSVFRSGWLHAPESWNNIQLRDEFSVLKQLRGEANQLLEQARAAKLIGSSLEATIEIQLTGSPISSVGEDVSRSQGLGPDQDQDHQQHQQFNDRHHKISAWSLGELLNSYADELKSLFITSDVSLTRSPSGATSRVDLPNIKDTQVFTRDVLVPGLGTCRMVLRRATMHKCPRCWTFTSVEADTLCARCAPVVAALQP
ncbi:MAG: Isoleucyl-tRNA synthetase [Benniella sp.]|nr:MAG: Isoleucyl-tRNA synthetase [Benniella sp.]